MFFESFNHPALGGAQIMKRKKISTKPPAKKKETPAKEENSYPQEVEEKILEQKNKETTISEKLGVPKGLHIYYGSKWSQIRSSAV